MLIAFLACCCVFTWASSASGQPPRPLTEAKIVGEVTHRVDRALAYLASVQRVDGGWDNNHAPNALALLAFLGRGHTPTRGPYQDVLQKGKNYLVRSQNDQGLFVSKRKAGSGPMYTQGLATLACAELYGMDPDPALEKALRKAVDLLVRCQSKKGGWRYHPKPGDQDLSVTVMQIVALRAANNAEIPVPAETIEKAKAYVKSLAHPQGGFGYTSPGQKSQTTAAGIVSLQLLGDYNDPTVIKGLDHMIKIPVEWKKNQVQYFYYFHYYAIQACYQAGGKYWSDWHPKVRRLLLEKQNADGSWDVPPGTAEKPNVVGPNKVYWTSMACLVLEIYMHYLPAYQR